METESRGSKIMPAVSDIVELGMMHDARIAQTKKMLRDARERLREQGSSIHRRSE